MTPALEVTAFGQAQRYVDVVLEREGEKDHPLIQWWLSLCGYGLDAHDETAWCSAFVNGVAYDLGLPRSKSAAARSWLPIGEPVRLLEAEPRFDVVVMSRGGGNQPGASVLDAPGHVGFFAGLDGTRIRILGGNQDNRCSIESYPIGRVLGVRRIR